ncbi:hypothetical protein CP533_5702 [Ophiocordyceps camponoti-saundersi (nom. inval.)]|nr:hypothetical protein CP533_5702 [Ophiocordyceps camponoti-saundersi (nom. inval.)]
MDGAKHTWLRNAVMRRRGSAQDWEDWEDVQVLTPVPTANAVSPAPPPERTPPKSSASRRSSTKVKRLRSRQRQKAQNAKAGIKLITDMTVFKRNHNNNNSSSSSNNNNNDSNSKNSNSNSNNPPSVPPADARPPKFVDAAALRALEGEPSSDSIGSFSWLRRDGTRHATPELPEPELSPEDRPIVIGISIPSDRVSARHVSQQASIVDVKDMTPAAVVRSVWSPDTPNTASTFNYRPSGSSMASMMTGSAGVDAPPPVPALPAGYNNLSGIFSPGSAASSHNEDDDSTPCTLFEEDGSSALHRPARLVVSTPTPDSATSRAHGWWDHVITPFSDKKLSLLSYPGRKFKVDSPRDGARSGSGFADNAGPLLPVHAPIVREPSPRRDRSPSIRLPSRLSSGASSPCFEREAADGAASGRNLLTPPEKEQPPPYSPPKKKAVAPPRFRAVFPTEHPLHAQFPPSPFPASPGLGATMTSQGVTPNTRTLPMEEISLPTRPPRAFVGQSYTDFTAARAQKVERQRRRHEKEDVVARRVGGFWRGRGCMPATGCFGRGGREGRKRRRTWLAVWAGVTSLVILVAVLSVVLTRRHGDVPVQGKSAWVNLTDFPPMPTGAWTVVGPDNSISRSACTEPSTLWSCSLPKEEHNAAASFKANQPTVALQIQWKGDMGSSHDVKPEPEAPDVKEMWFLGNTTDNVQSEHKAGEETPFYISLSTSATGLTDAPKLTAREAGPRVGDDSLEHRLPSPDLEADGTAAAAVMIPRTVLQPVRLYDRGLDSERYGFYIHFKRSIFLKSVTILNETEGGNVPLDEDGGCRKNEADYVVTWGETRMLVQMWTRSLDLGLSSLLRPDTSGKRPGSLPYPVTLTLDTHGGKPDKKVTWNWPLDKRQKVMVNNPQLLVNRMDAGGSWINPRGTGDPRLGGFDGGTGGCKCEWVNWVRRTP